VDANPLREVVDEIAIINWNRKNRRTIKLLEAESVASNNAYNQFPYPGFFIEEGVKVDSRSISVLQISKS